MEIRRDSGLWRSEGIVGSGDKKGGSGLWRSEGR